MDASVVVTLLMISVQLVNGFYENAKVKRSESNNQTQYVNTASIISSPIEKRIVPKFIDGTRLKFLYWNSRLGNNRSIKIEFGNESSIVDYWIDGLPLKVITHGWLASQINFTGVFCIKTAYVDTGGFNVISVDWSSFAMDILYPVPAVLTEAMGLVIAEFLKRLMAATEIMASDIHLIGHSLGAHVMGSCGFQFRSEKIGRITGLDPASPGFEILLVQYQYLNENEAEFVDVFHTSAGTLGFFTPIGHVDFYPNGGTPPQPGCDILQCISCSHSRSYELYADSVYHRKSLVGLKFPSFNDFKIEKDINYTKAWMGHDAIVSTRGIFYGRTNAVSPYGVL